MVDDSESVVADGAVIARVATEQRRRDALLKAGQCLQALGDSDGARASFEEIVKRFPESAAAVVAHERLEAMR